MPTGDTGLTAFLMDLSTGEIVACGNLESVEMEMTTTEQEEAVGLFDTREISFEIEDKSVIEQLLEAFRPKPKEKKKPNPVYVPKHIARREKWRK